MMCLLSALAQLFDYVRALWLDRVEKGKSRDHIVYMYVCYEPALIVKLVKRIEQCHTIAYVLAKEDQLYNTWMHTSVLIRCVLRTSYEILLPGYRCTSVLFSGAFSSLCRFGMK
jgi:hypothetical protein